MMKPMLKIILTLPATKNLCMVPVSPASLATGTLLPPSAPPVSAPSQDPSNLLVTKLQDSVSARKDMEDTSVISVLEDKWNKVESVLRVKWMQRRTTIIHVPYLHA